MKSVLCRTAIVYYLSEGYTFYSKKFVIENIKLLFHEDSNKSNAYEINNLVTEIMPRNETETDITGYENVEIDDENEEEIRAILGKYWEGGGRRMSSTVDIPDDICRRMIMLSLEHEGQRR